MQLDKAGTPPTGRPRENMFHRPRQPVHFNQKHIEQQGFFCSIYLRREGASERVTLGIS